MVFIYLLVNLYSQSPRSFQFLNFLKRWKVKIFQGGRDSSSHITCLHLLQYTAFILAVPDLLFKATKLISIRMNSLQNIVTNTLIRNKYTNHHYHYHHEDGPVARINLSFSNHPSQSTLNVTKKQISEIFVALTYIQAESSLTKGKKTKKKKRKKIRLLTSPKLSVSFIFLLPLCVYLANLFELWFVSDFRYRYYRYFSIPFCF